MELRNIQIWLNRLMLQPRIYAEDILELLTWISDDIRRETGVDMEDLPAKGEKDIYLLQKKTDYLTNTLKEKTEVSERKVRALEEKRNTLEEKIKGGLGTDTVQRMNALQDEITVLRDVVQDMSDYLGYIPETTQKDYEKYGFVNKLDRMEKELLVLRNRYKEMLQKTEEAAKNRFQGDSDNGYA